MDLKTFSKPLLYAAFLTTIIATVFLGVHAAFQALTIEQVPEFLRGWFSSAAAVVAAPNLVFIVLFVRNVFGYFNAYVVAQIDKEPEVKYNVQRYAKSAILYISSGVVIFQFVPPPYNSIAYAAIFIVDLVVSELKRWT